MNYLRQEIDLLKQRIEELEQQWTTGCPKTEGQYWFDAGSRGATPVVVPVFFYPESIRTDTSGYRFGDPPGVAVEMVGRNARWSGPIQPPEESE
jgi:hypothetical protein